MKGSTIAATRPRLWLPSRVRGHFVLRRREYLKFLRKLPVALTAFVLAFVLTQWWDFTIPSLGRAQYQAVFLTNGQTYFGRYYERIGAYVKIEDVYYLQQSDSADPNATPSTRLVRRGSELHGPDHRMLVPKSAILFVEDLTSDSPIAQFMRQDGR